MTTAEQTRATWPSELFDWRFTALLGPTTRADAWLLAAAKDMFCRAAERLLAAGCAATAVRILIRGEVLSACAARS